MATNNAINQRRPTGCMAYLSASTTDDKTGDATIYRILFDSTLYTDGNYSAATGNYTVTNPGRYLVSFCVKYNNLGAHPNTQILVGSRAPFCVSGTATATGTQLALSGSIEYPVLVAGNAVNINALVANGTKTVGIVGSGAPYSTWFSINRIG